MGWKNGTVAGSDGMEAGSGWDTEQCSVVMAIP